MRASLSAKLLAITTGVISLAVALAGAALLREYHRDLRDGFESGTVVLARSMAEHCVGPLVFGDPSVAGDMLAKLEHSTPVERAVLYDDRGNFVAGYNRPGAAGPMLPVQMVQTAPAIRNLDGYLHVFEPVIHRDIRQGTLYLVASGANLRAKARAGTLMILLVGLLAIGPAAALAWVLQRSITRPILRLAETMRGITGKTMLSTRVERESRDELGVLYAGFNRMLDQLAASQQDRDRSDARLGALIAALPDPVFVLDERGRIVEVFAGHPERLALPPADLRGKGIAEVTAPGSARQFEEGITRALASHTPQRFAYELDLTAGKRWFDAVLVPIDARGDRFVLCVPRDVTERHTLEFDLRQAQKMEALGRLAGGVAHDFNNILTAIMGYGAFLEDRLQRDGRPLMEVSEILKAAKRAASLTKQLLAFSRHQLAARRAVGLNGLVRDMQRMLERIIGEDVQLVADLALALPAVLGDPGQLQQVILNLAVNAREAMPNGGTLTLRTLAVAITTRRAGDPELAPGRYVLFEVADTGVGMDEATCARIFEPFFTTKDRVGGTGLGLAMVYGIVRNAGGAVTVTSEPDRGATFRIYLPELPLSSEATESAPLTADAPLRGNETILVVEDEPQLKELTCRMLRENGYEVLGAGDASEALEICAVHRGPIHLLLTDMVMPHMGGAELVEAARPMRPNMRVLRMSGYSGGANEQKAVASEPVPFLQKPFTPDELSHKVREALGTPAPIGVPSEPAVPFSARLGARRA